MSCCPPNSAPYYSDDYSCKGTEGTLSSGLEYYSVGEAVDGGNAIIIIPDVWGWDGGRTRRIADFLAGSFNFVIVPKLMIPAFEGISHTIKSCRLLYVDKVEQMEMVYHPILTLVVRELVKHLPGWHL